jgi:hypothetical protein
MTAHSMVGTLIEYARFAMQMCKVMTGQTCTDLELPKAIVSLYETNSTLHRKFENVSSKYHVVLSTNSWLTNDNKLKSISLLGTKQIPHGAFDQCRALERVNFPKVFTIENWAFGGCTALTELNLPNAVTVGQNLINGSAVKKISLPKVTSIPYQGLYNAPELEEAYLESVETTSGDWLKNCPKLRVLVLGKVSYFVSCLNASTELEYLSVKEGTTASLPLYRHPKLTEECILQIFENYADFNIIQGSATVYLSQEQSEMMSGYLFKLDEKNVDYEVV